MNVTANPSAARRSWPGYREITTRDGAALPEVLALGMYASEQGGETFAQYQECRLRHVHETLDKYLGA